VAVLLGGLAVVYTAGTAFRAAVVAANPPWAEQSLLWLPMFADLFAIGMALAVISAAVAMLKDTAAPADGSPGPARSLTGSLSGLSSWCGRHPAACWAVAGLIFFVVTRMPYPTKPFGLRDVDGSSDYLPRQFLYGIASAAWLAPAIFGDQTKGRLRRLLAARPLVYLGAVSLSFYLWHLMLIDQVKQWTVVDWSTRVEMATHPPPGNMLASVATFTGNYAEVVLISWVLAFAVASVLYRLVELRFLRIKDQPLRTLFRRDLFPRRPVDGASPRSS
jgi:peptidoglycan/LPS O-acetylase OafA/YrhL